MHKELRVAYHRSNSRDRARTTKRKDRAMLTTIVAMISLTSLCVASNVQAFTFYDHTDIAIDAMKAYLYGESPEWHFVFAFCERRDR